MKKLIFVRQNFIFLMPLIFILIISSNNINCAKKMLPPSPDRFAPRLQQINPINKTRIDLVFDEPINVASLNPSDFQIISVNKQETLAIKLLTYHPDFKTITIYTNPAINQSYQLLGTLEDRFSNTAIINRRFTASRVADTTPPQLISIEPKPATTNKNRNVYFEFKFSESIDTTTTPYFIIYPLDKTRIHWQYTKDWQGLTFGYAMRKQNDITLDSLPPKTTVYFILMPTLSDLANNRMSNCAYTYFTTESVLSPLIRWGTLNYQNNPYPNGIIIFSNQNQKVITISQLNGDFSVQLDTTFYQIIALADTNYDKSVDLYAELNRYHPLDSITLNIPLSINPPYQKIDDYLR
ncbi:MAG: Ig-like domain-containing protein [candidate division WOR-3 bacterium]